MKRVDLGREDEAKIEEALARLEKPLELPRPPDVIDAPYCKKCAYHELCYG
ncbi:Dna2/Cas4 domain-containing protein [Hydrogenobacter thermophilus]|uniref:Dna2/Cas4 domain-containing protein n=1 Tax=Hydrogenobacter thermophilus TaxID=940 RepID=UPI0031B81CF4